MAKVTKFTTEGGKEGISLDGFSYRRAYTGVDGTIYWRCLDDRHCSGRLSTDARQRNPVLRTEHNDHFANPERAQVREVIIKNADESW